MIFKVLITCCALAAPVAALAAEPVQDGMTVVRDPQTGTLRAPTAAELRAMRKLVPQTADHPPQLPPPVKSTVRADGSRAIDLGERGLIYSVITRNPDGSLDERCVKGGEAAVHAVERHQEAGHDLR